MLNSQEFDEILEIGQASSAGGYGVHGVIVGVWIGGTGGVWSTRLDNEAHRAVFNKDGSHNGCHTAGRLIRGLRGGRRIGQQRQIVNPTPYPIVLGELDGREASCFAHVDVYPSIAKEHSNKIDTPV